MGVGGAAARSLKVKAGQAVCARGVTSAPILLKNYGLRGFAVADSLWSLRPG